MKKNGIWEYKNKFKKKVVINLIEGKITDVIKKMINEKNSIKNEINAQKYLSKQII